MNDEAGHDYERELDARGFRWDERRRDLVLHGTLRRVKRRKTIQLVVLTNVVTLAAVAGIMATTGTFKSGQHDAVAVQTVEPLASPKILEVNDGSRITLEGPESEAHLSDQSPRHVAVQLDRGRGRFQVTKNPERTFEVGAGHVTVTVVGTEFVVERRQERAWVQVTSGTVRVSWPGGEELMRAPAENLFPPSKEESAALPPAAPNREGITATPSASALLQAADTARVAGRDDEAMHLLRRVMREHPADPQARMAAFVLGRMLAAKGRSAEAMQAFAEARRPGKGDSLGEDALARQVEVARDSGDRAAAKRLADEFARSYPKSSRLEAVKRMGEAR